MQKPDSAFVRCICCVRGCYGDRSCGAGAFTRDETSGCFNGRVRPTGYAQKKNAAINQREFSDLIYPKGVTWQGRTKDQA